MAAGARRGLKLQRTLVTLVETETSKWLLVPVGD